jgi:rhamnopyranosyl-N-acetylglucosaminyl-diphospho-decaprenol beta-1,3/1,4-galactofuranosyltransferase
MSGVCAVVVTHNRREMLRRCLAALADQRRVPDRILVVDNASSDGTREMLEDGYEQVELLPLRSNEGGAGGFHEGIKRAYATGAEWLWLMDDDTIATPDALAELLDAAERLELAASVDGVVEPAVLASRVVWRGGAVHPMNYPILERRRMELVIAGATHGVAPIRGATFVSLLLRRRAVERHGLPLKHFFLWADDIEYTSRIVLAGEGAYFVPASVALHDTPTPEDFRTARPQRFYYHVRNTLLMALAPGRPWRDRLLRFWILASTTGPYVLKNRDRATVAAVWRGLSDGWRDGRRPRR